MKCIGILCYLYSGGSMIVIDTRRRAPLAMEWNGSEANASVGIRIRKYLHQGILVE